MSLDQIGPLAKTVNDAALMLSIINGKDELDSISESSKEINLEKIKLSPKKLKIGILGFQIKDKQF
jgi:aspartyl-tRNA(Asn)/glutamyl-tRNA(Gln) amidotransferase subunit A